LDYIWSICFIDGQIIKYADCDSADATDNDVDDDDDMIIITTILLLKLQDSNMHGIVMDECPECISYACMYSTRLRTIEIRSACDTLETALLMFW
jgi:hypothetical protein